MKKFYFVFVCASILIGCKGKVTDYYLFSYYPPVEETDYFGYKSYSKPKFDINKIGYYESDSIAIATESERIRDMRENFSEDCQKALEDEEKKDPEHFDMKKGVIIQAYKELYFAYYTMIIFTHNEGYDASDFIEKVKEYGIDSNEMEQYIKDNQLEVRFVPLR